MDNIKEAIENLDLWSVKMIRDRELCQDFMTWAIMFDGPFTVVNQILIYLQCNDATIVKTKEEWSGQNIRVRENSVPIKVIFRGENGYLIRELFDITQVDMPKRLIIRDDHDIQDKVDAIMAGSPVKHKKKHNIGDTKTHFMYDAEDGVIYFKSGVDSLEQIFVELAREYSHFSIKRLLDTKLRMEQLGIRSERTETMKYTRGFFKPMCDITGFLVADICKVTDFKLSRSIFSDVALNPFDARTVLGFYTETGRCVRHMYEHGIEQVDYLKNEYKRHGFTT